MKTTLRKTPLLSLFSLLFFSSLSPVDSASQCLNRFIRNVVMPFDVITESGQVRWEGYNPIPACKTAEEVRLEMTTTDFDERFSGDYDGSKGPQTSARFVKSKLENVIQKNEPATVQQQLIYKYGPLCPAGLCFTRGAHTMPYTLLATSLKYMMIASFAPKLYCAAKEVAAFFRNNRTVTKKRKRH